MSFWLPEKNDKRSWRTIIGCSIIIVLLGFGYYPGWLFWTTYSSEQSVLKDQTQNPSREVSETARTNIVNIFCNTWYFDVCDQGCEVVNMYWLGSLMRNGKYRCQPVLDMYFSTYTLQTDTIAQGNLLVLYLSNGDSIAIPAIRTSIPKFMGGLKRYTACHAYRTSVYAPLSAQETSLLRTQHVVALKVESKHDILIKNLDPAKSDRLQQRFVFISNAFTQKK